MAAEPRPKTKVKPDPLPKLSASPFQRQIILEWQADERPFRRLNKQSFSTIIAMAFLFGVILFFIEGAMPVITLIAFVFLVYVMGTIPPKKVTHRLTNWGIETQGHRWPWEQMTRFWIEGEKPSRMAVIELVSGFPRHLRLLLGEAKEDQLKELLEKYLINDRPQPNWLEKIESWTKSKINLAA